MRWPFVIVATLACAALLNPCTTSASTTGAEARGRQFTAWFHAGNLDSLFGAVRAFDLSAPGDSIVARWVREPGGPIPPNWPEASATLDGLEGLGKLLQRARAMYGHESALVEEAAYVNQRSAGDTEYFRISKFTDRRESSMTMSWAMNADGTSRGGWLMPTPKVAPSRYDNYKQKTNLRLPFDGEWMILQGGRKPHENDHLFHEPIRFACDFIVVRGGLSFSGDGTKNSDHYAFGQAIVAPAPGRVIAAVDTFSENTPLQPRPGYQGPGNLVVIDHGDGEYSVLAHLKLGSVTVARGDTVRAGDKIGECGNNGFSTEPHLHYQLQLGPGPGGSVVPAVFSDYWADGVHVERGEPRKGQQIRAAR